jgi:uncharacterized protein (UPF0333 family)
MGLSKRGQSLLEYSFLFAVILSALLIMQFYIQRGYQGRLKAEADSVGQQYSPGHTTSKITNTNRSFAVVTTAEGRRSEVIAPAISRSEKFETVDAYGREW